MFFVYLADSETVEVLWQMRQQRRQTEPDLPDTVTRLTTPEGSIVYLVGTAHFSDSSKKDVSTVSTDCLFLWINIRSTDWSNAVLILCTLFQMIRAVQPDVVVVELCQYRVSMLKMDEKTLLKEAKDINLEKVQQAIKQVSHDKVVILSNTFLCIHLSTCC